MKTRRFTLFIVTCSLFFALAFFGCKEEPDPTPQEHSGTITAFEKTITVKGDASISKTDFDSALEKLQEAMTIIDEAGIDADSQARFETMLNRDGFAIIISTGDTGPNADTNKSMTIGIDYLLENDVDTILGDIFVKVVDDKAFAD